MTDAGRPRKPSNLKVLHGTDRADRSNDSEPQPREFEEVPSPPHWLDHYAKKEWEQTAPFLIEAGLLTRADLSMYTAYCQLFARVIRAEMEIMEKGLTFETPNGHVQKRPETTISRDALQQLRQYSARFGLDPASRSSIEVSIGDEQMSTEEILDNASRD